MLAHLKIPSTIIEKFQGCDGQTFSLYMSWDWSQWLKIDGINDPALKIVLTLKRVSYKYDENGYIHISISEMT